MSWRGGRRAKGRRGGDQDPGADSSAWLAELEQEAAAADDDEEDWADKLRGRRTGDLGAPPPGPPLGSAVDPAWSPPPAEPPWSAEPPPPARPAPDPRPAPDYRLLGMEPDDRRPASDWDVDWGTQDPLARPSEEQDWSSWGDDQGGSAWWTPTPEERPVGGWSGVEPSGREPDYPALFGELNRRHPPSDLDDRRWAQAEPELRAEPEAPPAPTPEPAGNGWPFEETTQSWEPSDRSFVWPSQELPPATNGWDTPSPSWLDEPWTPGPVPPPAPVPPPGPVPSDQWDAGQAGAGAIDADPATRRWRPDDLVEAEPLGPLGTAPPAPGYAPAPDGWEPAPPETPEGRRAHPPEGRRRVRQLDDRPRKSWPRVVAVISWIVLLMVVCWFYVFPWLERVLPENF
jgi:hypothetical protein